MLIWSHLLKNSLIENFIFLCSVSYFAKIVNISQGSKYASELVYSDFAMVIETPVKFSSKLTSKQMQNLTNDFDKLPVSHKKQPIRRKMEELFWKRW